jgi:Glycosyltransferases involved in cell wall biogenesis
MVEKYPTNFDLHTSPPNSSNPKVSVLIDTYNQEGMITQAISSVLMQAVDFDYEIVIGEDASTDRTREIVIDMAEQHPEKIRLLLRDPQEANRDRALGLAGKINFLEAIKACRGEYIAVLDGDDYFTDPRKLQKQVDFLDTHPECVICFHNVTAMYLDDSKAPHAMCPENQEEITGLEHLLLGNFIPTCSIMYRREPVVDIPDWFLTARMGDWPLNIFKAKYGKIGYLNEVMATYRVHGAGAWSGSKRSHQLLTSIKVLDNIDRDFGFKYRNTINIAKSRFLFELAEIYLQRGHSRLALLPLKKGLRFSRGRHKPLVILWLRLKTPNLYRGYTTLKNFTSKSFRPTR